MCQDKRVSNLDLVVIAGPQASGKTTGWEFLKNKYGQMADFYEEINPYVVFPEKAKLGGLVVTPEMQLELHKVDIDILRKAVKTDKLKVFETLMFHGVYYPQGLSDYKKVLERKKVGIIFIDVKPEISFRRRKKEYLRRIEQEINEKKLIGEEAGEFEREMMDKYRQRIEKLYPLWKRVYDEIDYAEKRVIDNNDLSEEEFLKQVVEVFEAMLVI